MNLSHITKPEYISIVTPCYNAKDTISQTIESVLAQSFSDWKMIIVDDCSSDGTADIIKSYITRDSRISYFKTAHPSGSPSLPRNIGLENAKGKYIAFLDSDDMWLPDKLEKQMKFIEENDYEFVYSNYEKISYSGNRTGRIVTMPKKSTFWDVLETCTIPCLTAVISSNRIGNHRFKSIPKEDFAFWLEILKEGVIAYNQGEVLALYRVQQKSRSSNKFKMIKNQWFVLRQIEGVKPLIAVFFMIPFIFNGILKYLK